MQTAVRFKLAKLTLGGRQWLANGVKEMREHIPLRPRLTV